jgi:hypothetical protein
MSSNQTAQAQQLRKFCADTGVVKLGANQALRVTVAWDLNNDGESLVGFSGIEYAQQGACQNGVCKHAVSSVFNNNPVALMPGEAASFTYPNQAGESQVRAIVSSNRQNLRATAAIIDTLTGATVTQIIMANTEGDF